MSEVCPSEATPRKKRRVYGRQLMATGPCKVCGRPLIRQQKNCCSIECQRLFYQGPNHCGYKGGSRHIEGYRVVCVDGKAKLEHRVIMEAHLGRPLLASEVVHHRDGNKANNSLDNLQLLSSQVEHLKEHRKSFSSETHRECTRCGEVKPRTEFYPKKRREGERDPHHPHCKACQCSQKRQEAKEKREARTSETEGRQSGDTGQSSLRLSASARRRG